MAKPNPVVRRSRRAPTKKSEFEVGDLVQITRNGTTLQAKLAQCLTEGSSVHPRWLIKFEGPYKDEEVYEHILVKVGDEDEEGVDGDADADDEGPESSEGRISDVSDPAVLPLPATTDAPLLGSSEGSDSSTDPRAQRSKRRQVKIETKGPKNVKKQRKADDGNCLKVKLLTGTLYLYRGKHARAEFVRRV